MAYFSNSIRRRSPTTRPPNERIPGFKEVNLGFTPEAAVEEARRCLGCGLFSAATDIVSCCGLTCRICMDSCWKAAIKVSDQN